MAIIVGSIVAVKINSAALASGSVCPQPPAFGVSESASTPFDVVWSATGTRTTAVLLTSLDEITAADAQPLALVGTQVTRAGYSPVASSVVVSAYKRNAVNVLLLKSQAGVYSEALATAVTPLV